MIQRIPMVLAGYLHPDYSASFSALGTPLLLPTSQGWILKRIIPGTMSYDAMGCYPLFCCVNWQSLRHDLEALEKDLVSIVLVADPLGDHSAEMLEDAFDHVIPFKEHFVIQTGPPLTEFVSKSHRGHAMRALKKVRVDLCPEPVAFIDDWERLYGVLSARHCISGLRRFSRAAFERQLAVPGMVMFRATVGDQTVGIELWYVQGHSAQSHLTAFDAIGYQLRASYALRWQAIEYLSSKVRWINLGGGTVGGPGDGLSAFKRGWSTGTKITWLCGRVLQPQVYAELARTAGVTEDNYFPAYRRRYSD
jgi:hypothetical protein